MGEVWLGGRLAVEWELPALERARQCERDRDTRVLAGLLTGEPVPRHDGRTVDDVLLELK